MRFGNFLIFTLSVFTLALVAPAIAKDKPGQNSTGSEQTITDNSEDLDGAVLADAIRLCDLLITDDASTIDVMEAQGWSTDLEQNTGNYVYYKELSGSHEYPDVGFATFWGFIEDYPGHSIGYCSFSISNPEIRFSISAINEIDQLVGDITIEGDEVYGTWRDISAQPSIFIHAYHNGDTFAYQINRINKLN